MGSMSVKQGLVGARTDAPGVGTVGDTHAIHWAAGKATEDMRGRRGQGVLSGSGVVRT